ncbi:MAG: triose-phosphate isomerase family protein [Bacilli bacterium]|nr:triose-phosphate isomerase family protein [Bacilli bacterium]
MEKMIVLNHKMSLEYDQVFDYINKINAVKTDNNIVICPSNIYLDSFINYCNWGIGSQNFSYRTSGNYTGDVSILQLKSMGIEYSLIGHYERKKYFNETDEIIHKKLVLCLDSNIIPILCFGETGDIDDIKKSLDILLKDIAKIDFIIFAYEPLKVSKDVTIEQIRNDILSIYDYLFTKYHSRPNIIYGGGVSNDDINELLSIDNLNGILVGKVSSNADKIVKVIEGINK